MKKIKTIKNKLILFLLTIIFPLSATGLIFSLGDISKAEALAPYYTSFTQEKTMSNNNFSSGVTNYNLGKSLTGWTGKMPEEWATSGVITTGSAFQNYSSNRFHLRNNPSTKDSDLYVLMINSKTENSSDRYTTNQGYVSNSIKLEANSYYYFQVSFKTDTNYDSRPNYTQRGLISEEEGLSISQTTFGYINESRIVEFGEYIQINYAGSVYYVEKKLTSLEKTLEETIKDVNIFYTDEKYVGFLYKDQADSAEKPVFVSKDFRQENYNNPENENEVTYDIISGAELFECSIIYNPSTKNYTIPYETPYYDQETEYISINDKILGSIYLSGIDLETEERAYVGITSKDWTTLYFFVATGNKEEDVTLDLWLGSEDGGIKSSGVVFYDACHLYQCSENAFWETYDSYERTKYYSYEEKTETESKLTTQKCTKLIDLREDEETINEGQNFNFEKSLDIPELWIVDPERVNGEAQVFDTFTPGVFKKTTNRNFVGSNLSCEATYDENKSNVKIETNNKVLALWANDGYVSIKTKNAIEINANEIYKIKVNYKVSELESGNVYVKVKESENIFNGKYKGLTKDNYTLTSEVSSTGVNSNGTNNFTNNYGTIEFYVKGGVLFDSAIDLSLALGSSSENANGCVLFDDITITKANTSEYSSATNKIELGSSTITSDNGITNGSFDLMTITENNQLYTPDNWTITKEESYYSLTYSGVVNTEENQWNRYIEIYNKLESELVNQSDNTKNPYYFVNCTTNPGSINGKATTNNVLMMINRNKTYQTLKSSNFTLDSNSIYELNFDYYISTNSKIRVSVYTNDGIKLFEKTVNSTGDKWNSGNSKYSIYFETLKEGAVEAYIQIDFGTNEKNGKEIGQTFFDNFKIVKNENDDKTQKFENAINKVKMSNYYFDLVELPTNLRDLTPNPKELNNPAYEGISNSNAYIAGIVKGQAFSKDHPLYAEGLTDKNVFFIGIDQGSSFSIDSKFTFDLNSSNYYTIKFKYKTSFLVKNEPKEGEEEQEYGVTVGLSTGFNYITHLKNNDKEYKEITIYFKPTETTSSKFHIALVCNENVVGNMALYDFSFEESTESSEDYTKIVERVNNAGEGNEFIAEAENKSEEDESDTDSETDTDNETSSSNQNGFDWLLIPALITGLAIVIAVIGTILRKVKIKKIERKRKETYDRKGSLNVDTIKQNARKERDAEIKALESEKEKFQNELNKLEELHKQKVLELRQKDLGKISKETDKEFKNFAQRTSVLAEKIENLNKQIEETNSPEHLLSLERKIYSQEEMKKHELEKMSKKENKTKENKTNKKN